MLDINGKTIQKRDIVKYYDKVTSKEVTPDFAWVILNNNIDDSYTYEVVGEYTEHEYKTPFEQLKPVSELL